MSYNYLVVDDEDIILEGMVDTVRQVVGEAAEIYSASDPYAAIEEMQKHQVDIIFSDVDMPGMNGLKFADKAHEINPEVDIIFATGFAHYSLDAWKTVAKAFILKPVTTDEIKMALDKVWGQREKLAAASAGADPKALSRLNCRMEAKCFGNFEIYYDGSPIHFARKKSKEMIAYLIDRRGAMVSTGEIRAALWDEDEDSEEKKGYIRVLANDIRKSMEDIGVEDFLRNDMDCYSVDTSSLACDYLDFLDGNDRARAAFKDEYMNQYPWAETTLGSLMDLL